MEQSGETGQASAADNAATVLSFPPKYRSPAMPLTMGGHNPTLPHAPKHAALTVTTHACLPHGLWSLYSQQKWLRGNQASGLLQYLLPEHTTHDNN